jgi:hypothetical protein
MKRSRIIRSIAAAAMLILLAAGATSAALAVGADSSAAPAPVRRTWSVKDSPGYIPLVDPESASVRIGRRLNAPLVAKPLTGGGSSLEDLGRTVVRLLNHDAADSLIALCVSEDEFRDILWREFPQSRPATHLEWLDGWKVLYVRHLGGISGAIRDREDHYYEFVGIEARDSIATYRNFRLHNGIVLRVRIDGVTQELGWIRSIAERKGRFKIYSTGD